MPVIPAPDKINIFGGANLATKRSADGSIFVVYSGERAGYPFGTHLYRVALDSKIDWVDYTPWTENRVDVSVEPDGMYLTYPTNSQKQPIRTKVQGFVTPAYPGGSQSFPPAPALISQRDEVARDLYAVLKRENAESIESARKNHEKALKKVRDELIAADNDLKATMVKQGVSESSAKDIAWKISADRLYAEFNDTNSPASSLVRRIVEEAVKKGK